MSGTGKLGTPVDVLSLSGARSDLSFPVLVSVLQHNTVVRLSPEALRRIQGGRDVIVRYACKNQVYGFSTGVGVLKTQMLEEPEVFQLNILKSHATSLEATGLAPDPQIREQFRTRLRLALTVQLSHYATGHAGVTVGLALALEKIVEELREPSSDTVKTAEDQLGSGIFVVHRTGHRPKRGEALPLMSHNSLAIASAVAVAVNARTLLVSATAAAAMTATAFDAEFSPFSSALISTMPESSLSSLQQACSEALLKLCGVTPTVAGRKQGARNLQDPLSMRTLCSIHAAVLLAITHLESTVAHASNTFPINPVVMIHDTPSAEERDVAIDSSDLNSLEASKHTKYNGSDHMQSHSDLVTNPNFDCIALKLSVDSVMLACAEMGGRSCGRMTNMLDPSVNGRGRFDSPTGAHNRNIAWICAASWNGARKESATQSSSPVRVADGVEDVSTGLSAAVASAHAGIKHLSTVFACELLVAWEGITCIGERGVVPVALEGFVGPEATLEAYLTEGTVFDLGAFRGHMLDMSSQVARNMFPSFNVVLSKL